LGAAARGMMRAGKRLPAARAMLPRDSITTRRKVKGIQDPSRNLPESNQAPCVMCVEKRKTISKSTIWFAVSLEDGGLGAEVEHVPALERVDSLTGHQAHEGSLKVERFWCAPIKSHDRIE